MPSLNQITADILNLASSGKGNYSVRLEEELVYFWINEARSKLISEALIKREQLSDVWLQAISCLEMIQVEASECCFVTTGCFILRSKKKLPPTIETNNDNSIVKVVTATGSIVDKGNAFDGVYASFNKYTGKKPFWYLQNGYLYMTDEQLITYLTVYGIFENPMDLNTFINCTDTPCFSIDDNYPVSLKMANDITNYVLRAKVLPFYSTIPDKSNDANSEDGLKNPGGLTQR